MHTDIHALSAIRTHDPSVRASEDGSCLRPRGHCVTTLSHHCSEEIINVLRSNLNDIICNVYICSKRNKNCLVTITLKWHIKQSTDTNDQNTPGGLTRFKIPSREEANFILKVYDMQRQSKVQSPFRSVL
jgi:hypothetical protein